MRAFLRVFMMGVAAGILGLLPWAGSSAQHAPVPGEINTDYLSSGGKAWWLGPQRDEGEPPPRGPASISLGSNVDANDPNKDLAAGQSETAIAAAGQRVMAAWNDATGFLVRPSTDRRASLTGVGFSANGGASFTDLLGLPNNNPRQQWFGDPAVVAVDNGRNFIVGSLYLPADGVFCDAGPLRFQVAVSVAKVTATNQVVFTRPIVAADGGDICPFPPAPDLSFLDKPFLGYDQQSRMLVVTYARFPLVTGFGTGQIEIVRAKVPTPAEGLRSSDFSAPIVIWPEEPNVLNVGSYVAVFPGGRAYVAWERNIITNFFNGDPYVYIHAAAVPLGAFSPTVGGPSAPRVVTLGQINSNGVGGVKSLDAVVIPGYSRGIGNDFPRLAVDPVHNRVIFVWNDASAHPLGDIWMRALPLTLDIVGQIRKVNDDNSFALHFMPAVSVRSDGSIATSWHDRRLHGPDSAKTDYFGEIRSQPFVQAPDFRITTGPTDWTDTGSFISPNFGDYTDNASTGLKTYFTWADGRLGVPQPFVDH